MLYEVAIIELPKRVKDQDEGKERLVLGPVSVIAGDHQGAAIEAVLANTEALKDVDRTRMKVMVRPFAS